MRRLRRGLLACFLVRRAPDLGDRAEARALSQRVQDMEPSLSEGCGWRSYFDAASLTAVEVLRSVLVRTGEVRARQGCRWVRPSVCGSPARPSRIGCGRRRMF